MARARKAGTKVWHVTCPLRAANAYEKRVLPGLWTEPRLVVWRGMTGNGTQGAVEQIEVLDPEEAESGSARSLPQSLLHDGQRSRGSYQRDDRAVPMASSSRFRRNVHGRRRRLDHRIRPPRDRAPRRSNDHRPSGCAASHATGRKTLGESDPRTARRRNCFRRVTAGRRGQRPRLARYCASNVTAISGRLFA